MPLIFDIETNGLLPVLDRIHCICLHDSDNSTTMSFADQEGYPPIEIALELLESAHIVAHNSFGFDIPAIQKVYPGWVPKNRVDDTLVMSRLMYPHLWDLDASRQGVVPPKLSGSHGLAAWGYRLGVHKGELGQNTDFQTWSKEMQDYCAQDVVVLVRLYEKFLQLNYPKKAIDLENEFSQKIRKQEENGIPFNLRQAEILLATLQEKKEGLQATANVVFPLRETKKVIVPKRDNAKLGRRVGVPSVTITQEPINLASRVQLIEYFKTKYNWQPKEYTEKGNPTLNADVFQELPFPEAKLVSEYLDVTKAISQLGEGTGALLNKVNNGYIHGRCNHNGARTGRSTHSAPNIAQIPKTKEFRELFHAPVGKVLVGADLKAIELRVLAHYLSAYDGGRYAKILLESDIHTSNQKAAGLATRDQAKRFIFAFAYGAGNELLGGIVDPTGSQEDKKKIGKVLREDFLSRTEGLDQLMLDVKNAYRTRGYLLGFDGRQLHPRAEYNSLNTLLQGGGAIIAKKWTCLIHEYCDDMDVLQHIHCHDEIVLSCHESNADALVKICEKAALDTGEFFNINLPIEANAKIGLNWHETH